MSDISRIKCPHCKKEYQNFLATQLKAELDTLQASRNRLIDSYKEAEADLAAAEKECVDADKMLGKILPVNTRLRKALERLENVIGSYPLTHHSGTCALIGGKGLKLWANIATQALNPKEPPNET